MKHIVEVSLKELYILVKFGLKRSYLISFVKCIPWVNNCRWINKHILFMNFASNMIDTNDEMMT
jgi:hypothetical protein